MVVSKEKMDGVGMNERTESSSEQYNGTWLRTGDRPVRSVRLSSIIRTYTYDTHTYCTSKVPPPVRSGRSAPYGTVDLPNCVETS